MYSHCDDQQSTLLWVHRHLEEFKNHDYQDVRSYFLECFPENAFLEYINIQNMFQYVKYWNMLSKR